MSDSDLQLNDLLKQTFVVQIRFALNKHVCHFQQAVHKIPVDLIPIYIENFHFVVSFQLLNTYYHDYCVCLNKAQGLNSSKWVFVWGSIQILKRFKTGLLLPYLCSSTLVNYCAWSGVLFKSGAVFKQVW